MAGAPGYGLPLKCPKCPPETAYGMLKVPGSRMMKCEKHGSSLEVSNRTVCNVVTRGQRCGLDLQPCKAECPNCGTRLVPSTPREVSRGPAR